MPRTLASGQPSPPQAPGDACPHPQRGGGTAAARAAHTLQGLGPSQPASPRAPGLRRGHWVGRMKREPCDAALRLHRCQHQPRDDAQAVGAGCLHCCHLERMGAVQRWPPWLSGWRSLGWRWRVRLLPLLLQLARQATEARSHSAPPPQAPHCLPPHAGPHALLPPALLLAGTAGWSSEAGWCLHHAQTPAHVACLGPWVPGCPGGQGVLTPLQMLVLLGCSSKTVCLATGLLAFGRRPKTWVRRTVALGWTQPTTWGKCLWGSDGGEGWGSEAHGFHR